MKQAGEMVQVLSVQPGERVYARMFEVKRQTETKLELETKEEPKVAVKVKVVTGETLYSDQRSIPPQVSVSEIVSHPPAGIRHSTYRAYFYDLEESILLILI